MPEVNNGGLGAGARRRICVVGSGWMFTSGLSYYTCRLSAALAERHDVSVVLMRRLIPRRLYPGRDRVGVALAALEYDPAVQVYDGIDWYWGGTLVRGLRFLVLSRPQTVILQWWTGAVLHTYLVLSLVARLTGARTVIEFHEVQDTGEIRFPLAGCYLRLVGGAVVALSSGVVVHSRFDDVEIRSRFRVAERPVAVVPHGPYDHVAAVRAPRKPGAACNVLFFGTIRPYKGLEHLVEAFNRLSPQDVEDLHLTVVGETWEGWTEPLRQIAASPYAERITLENRYVSDEEVASFFSAADAVVLPYLRSSASGPLHIAMACGLPVVLSDVGGLREAAEGYSGVAFVTPGDVDAIADALRALPSRAGARHADPQSWRQTTAAYEDLITTLTAPPV